MIYEGMTGEELELRFQKEGDPLALAVFFRMHRPLLASIALHFGFEDHVVDDLLADTRETVFRKKHELQKLKPGKTKKWFCETLKFKCRNYLDRLKHKTQYDQSLIKSLETDIALNRAADIPLVHDFMMTFISLSELDQNILYYQFSEGQTEAETAKILGISHRTVQVHKKSIREFLKK